MSERIISALMVVVAVYSAIFYVVARDYDMAALFAVLTLLSFYTVHAVWTAPIFAEDMPTADLQQVE